MVPSPRIPRLEVERKFVPTSSSISLLKHENLWPGPDAVTSLTPAAGLQFTDTYFDTPSFLLRNTGVCVRQRNSVWEMKTRQGGDLVSTGCIEIHGQAKVETSLKAHGFAMPLSALQQVAKINTTRSAWKIGHFTVSVDDSLLLFEKLRGGTLEIPHSVGEVELCNDVAQGCEAMEMNAMAREIDAFMERYGEVFGGKYHGLWPQLPEGKLAAYFMWEEIVSKRDFVPDWRWDDEKRGFVWMLRRL